MQTKWKKNERVYIEADPIHHYLYSESRSTSIPIIDTIYIFYRFMYLPLQQSHLPRIDLRPIASLALTRGVRATGFSLASTKHLFHMPRPWTF
jgi:hypothetical protein